MPAYDFKQLSSRDFEELTRDLLQAEWDVSLEAFKTGPDRGIDLRHISAHEGTTIVQCKHYVSSGYSSLLSLLRRRELEKVKFLQASALCAGYICRTHSTEQGCHTGAVQTLDPLAARRDRCQ